MLEKGACKHEGILCVRVRFLRDFAESRPSMPLYLWLWDLAKSRPLVAAAALRVLALLAPLPAYALRHAVASSFNQKRAPSDEHCAVPLSGGPSHPIHVTPPGRRPVLS